jgi:hypothetical protein
MVGRSKHHTEITHCFEYQKQLKNNNSKIRELGLVFDPVFGREWGMEISPNGRP